MTVSSIWQNKKNPLFLIGAVLLALLLWQGVAAAVGFEVLLPTPLAVLGRLFVLLGQGSFYASLWVSFSRIALGFFSALFTGVLLGFLAARFTPVRILLFPYMVTIRSVPVASFVVIALIWLSSRMLSVFISFLIVLPIVYNNMLAGFHSVDRGLSEMARVYRVPLFRRLRVLYGAALEPYLLSACATGAGLAFKSGVAAEIIGIPAGSVGEKLYDAKLYLDTVDLLAWTLAIVLLSVLFEKLFLFLLKRVLKALKRP